MSKKREIKVASDGGPELTSAGVPWSEVPEFARENRRRARCLSCQSDQKRKQNLHSSEGK